jgi:hypothetical protein
MAKTKVAAKKEILNQALEFLSPASGVQIASISISHACRYVNAFVACSLVGTKRVDPILKYISMDSPVHPEVERLGTKLVKLMRESKDEIAAHLAQKIQDIDKSDHPAARYLARRQRSRLKRHSVTR